MYETTESKAEKELIMKSMGNLGSVELTPHLTKIILQQSLAKCERISAIYALRRLVQPYNKQVNFTISESTTDNTMLLL